MDQALVVLLNTAYGPQVLMGEGVVVFSCCPITGFSLWLRLVPRERLRLLAIRSKSIKTRVVKFAEDSLHQTGMMLIFMLKRMLRPADKYAA